MTNARAISTLLLVAAASLRAQPPVTSVLATLSVKPGIDRAQLVKVMPEEVRETVKLYLDGKIQQWYSRGDGKGVVFVMSCKSAAEAKAITDALPLSKGGFVTFEFMTLGPLTPLRYLLGDEQKP